MGPLNHPLSQFSIQGTRDWGKLWKSKRSVLMCQGARVYWDFTISARLTVVGSLLKPQKTVGTKYISISRLMTSSLNTSLGLNPSHPLTSSSFENPFMTSLNCLKLSRAVHTSKIIPIPIHNQNWNGSFKQERTVNQRISLLKGSSSARTTEDQPCVIHVLQFPQS